VSLLVSTSLSDGRYSGSVVFSTAGQNQQSIPVTLSVVATGTIAVTTNLSAATFTVAGPATYTGTGTSATFPNAPVGSYTITFGPVAGYTAPAPQTQSLLSGGTISFTGSYSRQITVTNVSGWKAGPGGDLVKNAEWQGQPPQAPNRGNYYLNYAIDACQAEV